MNQVRIINLGFGIRSKVQTIIFFCFLSARRHKRANFNSLPKQEQTKNCIVILPLQQSKLVKGNKTAKKN